MHDLLGVTQSGITNRCLAGLIQTDFGGQSVGILCLRDSQPNMEALSEGLDSEFSFYKSERQLIELIGAERSATSIALPHLGWLSCLDLYRRGSWANVFFLEEGRSCWGPKPSKYHYGALRILRRLRYTRSANVWQVYPKESHLNNKYVRISSSAFSWVDGKNVKQLNRVPRLINSPEEPLVVLALGPELEHGRISGRALSQYLANVSFWCSSKGVALSHFKVHPDTQASHPLTTQLLRTHFPSATALDPSISIDFDLPSGSTLMATGSSALRYAAFSGTRAICTLEGLNRAIEQVGEKKLSITSPYIGDPTVRIESLDIS